MFLNLSSNQMSGVIPDLSSKFSYLVEIDLSSNLFNGPLPLILPNVGSLDISKNRIVGSISSLCDNAHITYLDLSDNLFSGDLPDCWKHINHLFILNLSNNNFTGEISSSLGSLNMLQSLHLRNNNFTGELPSSLKSCTTSRLIDLGGNNLLGRFPEWIGIHLKDLIILSISQNKLYGSIPQNLCNLNNIQVLDLSNNNLSGYVPQCFNNFTSLSGKSGLVKISIVDLCYSHANQLRCPSLWLGNYLEHAIVQWKGQIAEYSRKTLEQLKIIDLSSNKLTGEIPVELASLRDLLSLNLSRNYFIGYIPQTIGQMKMLESMDLSRNLLSGEIPVGLGSLTFLGVLDLSNNNFSGKIPPGTQLEGFNSSVYAANPELCGFPLPNMCSGLAPASKDKNGEEEDEDEDEDELITLGFYVSLILGFAVGFWGVFGTLQLKQSWRHAFFRFLNDMKDEVYVVAAVNMAKIKRMCTG